MTHTHALTHTHTHKHTHAHTHTHTHTQFELLDTLYVMLRQMPRFRRSSYFYAPASGEGSCRVGGGPTGREFDNMAEFLAYRCVWGGGGALGGVLEWVWVRVWVWVWAWVWDVNLICISGISLK